MITSFNKNNDKPRLLPERWSIKDKAKAIAKKMLEANVPIESIMQFTGLTREEVEGLREAS